LAIKAISDSINIINRLDPQITSFHHNIPENNGGYHHIDYKGEVERIVDGNSKETLLTADDLKKIRSERQLRHINIFHEALERSYAAWEALYLNRPVDGSNEHKLQYDKQMRQTIAEMKDALDRVLSFLQAANLEVEDHYYLFKNIVEEESRKLNDD